MDLPLAEMNSTALFMAGVILIVVVLLRRTQGRFKTHVSRKYPSLNKRPKPEPPVAHHLDAPHDVTRWEVQMQELARDLSAQIDSKLILLEQLSRTAAEQAARLEAAIQRAEQLGIVAENRSGERPYDPGDEAHNPERRRLFESSGELGWPAPNEIPAPYGETLSRLGEESHVTRAGEDQRHANIYRLADAGYSSAAIAHELGSPVGEVELILSLRHKS